MKTRYVLIFVSAILFFNLVSCADFQAHEERMYGTWEVSSAKRMYSSGSTDITESYANMQFIFKTNHVLDINLQDNLYHSTWMLQDAQSHHESNADNCNSLVSHTVMLDSDMPAVAILDGAGVQYNTKKKMTFYSEADEDVHYTVVLKQVYTSNPRGTTTDSDPNGN